MTTNVPDKDVSFFVDGKPNETFKKDSVTSTEQINSFVYYVDGKPNEAFFPASSVNGNFFLVFN